MQTNERHRKPKLRNKPPRSPPRPRPLSNRRTLPPSSPRSSPHDTVSLPVNDDGVEYYNPRSFPYSVKQQCWEKAEKVKGRDPERWRRDVLGNIVFKKLVGCSGCLCHDYDHILPYSKGGKSTLENCQVLQARVNRSKGNQTELSRADLIQKSSYCRVSGRDLDLLEMSAYGNVNHVGDSGGCRIQ